MYKKNKTIKNPKENIEENKLHQSQMIIISHIKNIYENIMMGFDVAKIVTENLNFVRSFFSHRETESTFI